MDGFAAGMTARGPTLGPDREAWTGSMHIVDLPSEEAAREFVEREPYNRAGLFEDHLIRRFTNRLGRTMWEFAADLVDPLFLVLAGLAPALTALPRERLIVHGELHAPDGTSPAGVVLALQAPTREAVGALLGGRQAGLGERVDVEILDWEFGGRR